ncbi:SdrD B-like domain-containing protein, partial [Coleofasciculus sp. F4-SAH-05]|uniref:SdrD B-like domain-containing protein n=1 Tax=Coleofasciculus sp. F4-SAH-05 TaxID=3069525 RepID=UPI0032F5EBAA
MPESNISSSLSAALPNELTFSIKLDAGSDPDASYLDITVKDSPGTENVLEGMTFDGYCIDTDRGISPNRDYTAKVYSSYESLPDELIGTGLIEKPENFDLVNWILNQGFEGQASTGNGTYTSGDVQRAVWSLLDDQQSNGGGTLGAWEQARVDEILDLAQDNGEGFVPEYDYTTIFGEQVIGKMGVILVPDSNNDGLPNNQIVIAEVELSKIGDTVWSDCDADGIQDGNEAGMAGVTVNLLADINGDGVIEESEVVDTTTTDANGNYEFTVIGGDYKVQFEQPENKLISPANQGGDDTVDSDGLVSDVVTLAPGDNDTTVDAGFYHPPSFKAALPGMLTFSIQLDAGSDPDASYVDITIKDVPGTDNIFEGMTFDGYCLDTDRPINRNVDYTAKVYSSLEPLPDELIGPGLIEKPENLDLINWILNQGFEGQLSTEDGTYTSGDVQRAIWELIDDQQSNGGGSLGAWEQARVDEILALAQSNGEGFVPEYDYTTIFGEQVVGKFGLILVPDTDGDCLPDKQIVIAEVELSKLGDRVWLDSDADGIQDAGEAGIADVTVNLFADIDGDGVFEDSEVVDTTTTDANGNYEFSVMAGEYQVQFEQPDGYEISPANQGGDDTVDSNGLVSDTVSLAPGENDPTIDSGFYQLASLGDKVFEDTNGNGLQDAGENGIANVLVKLQNQDGTAVLDGNDNPITTTTDADGEYSFTGLTPGEYKVMFVAPNGYIFSPQDAGSDDSLDSDANPSNGMTQTVTLESGEFDGTLDAGLLIPNPGIDIEKFVNGIDVTDLNNLPEIAAGTDVTFTYEVTNTGNVGFSANEVTLTDDNGTVGDTSDDFTPTLVASSDVGSDGILSAGETWLYQSATQAAQNLSSSTTSDIRFILTGSSGLDGSNGNVRSFTQDGVSVDVSAFSQNYGTWKNAYLGAYGGGLGVTNRDEGTSSHRVDNSGSTDYILFEFDRDVTVDKAFLDYVGYDSDMSIWIGDRNGADISNLSDSLLNGFTKENNFINHGGDRWADFNDAGLTGDTVVISAYTDGSNDSFKLKKLDVSVTETSFGE